MFAAYFIYLGEIMTILEFVFTFFGDILWFLSSDKKTREICDKETTKRTEKFENLSKF